MKPARFITMPHSHYCEKARWALDRSGIAYVEEVHAPLFHRMATRPTGGGSVPVLVYDEQAYIDSSDILLLVDRLRGGMFPVDTVLRDEVLKLEDEFDVNLGPHTRRWVYSQLLPHSSILRQMMSPGVSRGERALLPAVLPFAKHLIRSRLRISAESAVRSLERVHQVFRQVEVRLEDGRSFLVGGHLTAADITFAALAAPVLFPPGYRGALPALAQVPSIVQDTVVEFRNTIAGKFVLRLFAEQR